ncbi:MAG: GNAT family N-acetyltransferase [Haliscomenobacteraceae bacterium CHB4]|nr:hypothetical protein [Saprospiraceae bacterium]MCE7924868.1 GNAT family N-acetyltransferase [Haliscomenobacteraceae bacterium CHB4]
MPFFHFKPLCADTWPDLENLFGAKGACGGCWCMTWRLSSRDYERKKGEGNRELMHQLVESGQPLGIIAYSGNEPVGWCSVSPRDSLVRLENSRLLRRPDDVPVWSITCFFVKKEYRRKGLTVKLIQAATDYAFSHGAPAVEAYPMIAKKETVPEVFAFIGFAKSFEKAGFQVLKQPSDTRLIMRLSR